jgi:VanZ family protein
MRDAGSAWLKPKALGAWLVVALWAGIVLGLGSDAFSHSSTSRFLLPLLRWLLPDAEPATLAALLGGIRKAAHGVEYAALGILGYRALRLSLRLPLFGQVAVALGLVCAVAALDEALQSRSPLRSGRLADVGLDVAGGLAGVAVGLRLARSPRMRCWFSAPPGP